MHTSLQRCLDILSMPVMGSMKTSFATRVSGTQIAQSRCTQSPCAVCLKAPPSLGHKMHDCDHTIITHLFTRLEHGYTSYHRILRRDGAFTAEPLTFWNIRNTIAICSIFKTYYIRGFNTPTLMDRKIAPVAEHNGVSVLAF